MLETVLIVNTVLIITNTMTILIIVYKIAKGAWKNAHR